MPKKTNKGRTRSKAGPTSSTKSRRKSGAAGGTRRKSSSRSCSKRKSGRSHDRRPGKRKAGASRAAPESGATRQTPKPDVGTKRAPAENRGSSKTIGPAPTVTSQDLKALRGSLYLKQTHFAGLLNVDSMTVSRWERGVLTPRPWHRELLAAFKRATDAGFNWSRKSGYWTSRYELALDQDFELPKIPARLREILVAAHGAAKAEEGKKT